MVRRVDLLSESESRQETSMVDRGGVRASRCGANRAREPHRGARFGHADACSMRVVVIRRRTAATYREEIVVYFETRAYARRRALRHHAR